MSGSVREWLKRQSPEEFFSRINGAGWKDCVSKGTGGPPRTKIKYWVGSHSGRVRLLGKQVGLHGSREFESLSHRKLTLHYC